MGQIPRSTERISSLYFLPFLLNSTKPFVENINSTMPRPLEPVERAAFFGECTLADLLQCIQYTYRTVSHALTYTNCPHFFSLCKGNRPSIGQKITLKITDAKIG